MTSLQIIIDSITRVIVANSFENKENKYSEQFSYELIRQKHYKNKQGSNSTNQIMSLWQIYPAHL